MHQVVSAAHNSAHTHAGNKHFNLQLPSYMVDSATQKIRIPLELFGIIFSFIPPDQIPSVSRVCKQWNRWYSSPVNLKMILMANLPNRRLELGILPTTIVATPGLIDVTRFFKAFMRTILNIKEKNSISNATLSNGKVLACSFVSLPENNAISYRVSVFVSNTLKLVSSDQTDYLANQTNQCEAAVHHEGFYYFATRNRIIKSNGNGTAVIATFTPDRAIEELRVDGNFILALCNRNYMLFFDTTNSTPKLLFSRDRITAFELAYGKSFIAFDSGLLEINDRKTAGAIPKAINSNHEEYITSMKAKYGKVYLGNNKGILSVLDVDTEQMEKFLPNTPNIHMYAIKSIAVEDCFIFTCSSFAGGSRADILCHNRITRTLISSIKVDQEVSRIYFGLGMLGIGTERAGLTSHDFNKQRLSKVPARRNDPMEI